MTKRIGTILLDMDGVCCDFMSAANAALYLDMVWSRYDAYHDYGVSDGEFWRLIDDGGSTFWSEMAEYPWFWDLYCRCCECAANVVFCTTPSLDPRSLQGKLEWLQTRLGATFDRYVFTKYKHLLAQPGVVLIDDNEGNVETFRKAGGGAILFPQPWNVGRVVPPKQRLREVLSQLRQ